MSKNYWPVGNKDKNIHFRNLRDIQGPPQQGRGSGGGNQYKQVYHRVKVDVNSGNIIFEVS